MASFDKLTRANMMKYMQEELDEPQHADVAKKAKTDEEKAADEKRKAFDKRNKQFEEDKKVMPKRPSDDDNE